MLTVDPETATNPLERTYLRQFTRGKPDNICIIQFKNGAYRLAKRFFEVGLLELTRPELIERVKEQIAILERSILPIELDAGHQLVRMRTHEEFPYPPCATSSSNSSLNCRRNDAHIVENGFATASGVSKSAKVVLVRPHCA